jgi:hypothetical protein
MPAHRQEAGARGAVDRRPAQPGETLTEEAPSYRPFTYDEVAEAENEGARLRPAVTSAENQEPAVEVVREDGVVRELVVTCSCGRKTNLQVDYGEG